MRRDIPAFERFAEQLARRLAGGSIHPGQLMARVRAVVLGAVRDGVAPNQVTILMHPEDFQQYRPALRDLRANIAEEIVRIEREHGYRRVGALNVRIVPSDEAAHLTPRIEAAFIHTEHRSDRPREGETRRLMPIHGVHLLLEGEVPVPLAFVPFTIGRAADNDLVLPGAAVSRYHARIVDDGEGLVLEDLGSRNGVIFAGERVSEVALHFGDEFTIGDITLRLERTA
jgi:hypothetical protein